MRFIMEKYAIIDNTGIIIANPNQIVIDENGQISTLPLNEAKEDNDLSTLLQSWNLYNELYELLKCKYFILTYI